MSDNANKTEKLASAVYFITSFFDDKEPIKWRLRNLAADLVSQAVKDKAGIAREVLALFSIAKTAGLVSDTNFDILLREFSKFESEEKKPLELMFPREIAPITPIEKPAEKHFADVPKPESPSESVKDKSAEKSPLKEFGAVSVKKNGRQSTIIAILKRKKEIMIKDVTPLIEGCSEKTIQRELSAMVKAGVLKKVGEKRWSRYTLA